MAKRPFFEFILQVINLILTLWGLGTLGFGLVCFFKWRHTLPHSIHNDLFVYFIIGIGAILLIVSFLGYIGTAKRSPCSLFSYCVFLVLLILVELGISLFIFFDHSWKNVLPKDVNEDYHKVYNFVKDHWKIIRWIALGVFILQVIALLLAMYLQSVFRSAWYMSDEERVAYMNSRIVNYNRMVAPSAFTRNTTLPRTTSVRVNRESKNSTIPSNAGNNVNIGDQM